MRYEPLAPLEETLTVWHNPTVHQQHVDVLVDGDPRPRRYTLPPGSDREIPSRYDSAIHRVLCQDESCRSNKKFAGFCMKPGEHEGMILGGLAPLLRRKGLSPKLPDALDPTLAAKRALEAEQSVAFIAKTKAEETLMIAEAKKVKLDQASQPAAKR